MAYVWESEILNKNSSVNSNKYLLLSEGTKLFMAQLLRYVWRSIATKYPCARQVRRIATYNFERCSNIYTTTCSQLLPYTCIQKGLCQKLTGKIACDSKNTRKRYLHQSAAKPFGSPIESGIPQFQTISQFLFKVRTASVGPKPFEFRFSDYFPDQAISLTVISRISYHLKCGTTGQILVHYKPNHCVQSELIQKSNKIPRAANLWSNNWSRNITAQPTKRELA